MHRISARVAGLVLILALAAWGAAASPRPYGGAPVDVVTYHYDNDRTGWNPTESDLTPATVASAKFGLLKDLAVDGAVYAQPLLVSGFVMPDHRAHDVLIVATAHNSVYAFDADTFATLWQVNLGPAQSSVDLRCNLVEPEYGIMSTPLIIRTSVSAATLYVVDAIEPASMVFETRLHALSLATGADLAPPAEITGTATLENGSTVSFDPMRSWSRAGLAYSNGNLYVAITAHCDHNGSAAPITGWLMRYNRRLQLIRAFHTIGTPQGYELASIWMSGFAPAIDPAGDVFVVTGNGEYDDAGKENYGQSVLRIPANLPQAVVDRFTPFAYPSLNTSDTDFGSGGVMLLPPVAGQAAPPMAVAIGKDAVLYLLDQNNLGGLQPHDAGALQALRLAPTRYGVWGGPAYWDGPAGPTVFVQTTGDVLRSFSVSTGGHPAFAAQHVGATTAGHGGSIPIVSSDGASGGVVWLVRRSSPLQLEAYDAAALGRPIFSGPLGAWSNATSHALITPMEANGRVYAPGYLSVKVFGLSP